MDLNIPTGIPLIYELDDRSNAVAHYYLAEDNVLEDAVSEVANQTSSR